MTPPALSVSTVLRRIERKIRMLETGERPRRKIDRLRRRTRPAIAERAALYRPLTNPGEE